jgi:hypothetical protein
MATSAEVTADPQHQYFTISTNNITTSDTVNYYNFNGVLQGVRLIPAQLTKSYIEVKIEL